LKFAPMAIPAVALLQQHDARQDILIEPAVRRRAAIEAWGVRNWGRNRAVKTNRLMCVCVSDRHFYPSALTDFDETSVTRTLL